MEQIFMQKIVLWMILYNWHFTTAVLNFEKDFYLIFHTSDNSLPEAVTRKCSVKKVFLETSQNTQENTCARVSFLINLQAWGLRPATLWKKRLRRRCFPVNIVKFLRTPFLTEHLRWLLLDFIFVRAWEEKRNFPML